MKQGRAFEILGQVQEAVRRWPEFGGQAGVPHAVTESIAAVHRLDLLG